VSQEPRPSRPPEVESPALAGDRGLIFLTDASAELEGVAQRARMLGYTVVDVPLSLLRERVTVQPPALVLLDADEEAAIDTLGKLRELAHPTPIGVFAFGRQAGAIRDVAHAQSVGITRFFRRPIEEPALLSAIEQVLGPPAPRRATRPTLPPSNFRSPSQPPAAPSVPSAPLKSEPHTARSGHGAAGLMPPAPLSGPSLLPAARPSLVNPLSPELELMLAQAEQRVQGHTEGPLSPEEELEAVLPADLLDSLDEPIDEDDELDAIVGPAKGGTSSGTGTGARTGTGDRQTSLRREREARDLVRVRERELEVEREAHDRAREIERARELAHELERDRARAYEREREREAHERERERHEAEREQRERERQKHEAEREQRLRLERERERERQEAEQRLRHEREEQERDERRVTAKPPRPSRPPTPSRDSELPPTPRDGLGRARVAERPPPPAPPPMTAAVPSPPRASERALTLPPLPLREAGKTVVLGSLDAPRALAEAISGRLSGALAFASEGTLRRVLLREGDIVTAASSEEEESLVAFLSKRGELPRDVAAQLRPKLPPYGRHAGAALVAHGHLVQDQLWPVLRAHAEWVLAACLRVAGGTATLEVELTGRLKTEPNVFGGAPGVATFVEAVRSVFDPAVAAERLGVDVKLADGPNAKLVVEAHLAPDDARALDAAKGRTVAEVLESNADALPIAFALVLLGALVVVRALGAPRRSDRGERLERDRARERDREDDVPEGDVLALDEEAIRARVRARMAPVEDGDYFAVLGLGHDATGYEVRRAYLALRREFEPSRMLTAATADLREDVEHIAVVLEEAYEILRDPARRERYRRAITLAP